MPADNVNTWPLLASASAHGLGALTVRRHADGRILVHGSRGSWAGSISLPAGATMVDLVTAIRRVHAWLASAPGAADAADRDRWAALADKVIADLPEDL